MKKFIASIAAFALVVPVAASANTAAGSLSVKSAAVQPVRASAKPGNANGLSRTAIYFLLAGAVAGIIVAVSTGSSK